VSRLRGFLALFQWWRNRECTAGRHRCGECSALARNTARMGRPPATPEERAAAWEEACARALVAAGWESLEVARARAATLRALTYDQERTTP